MSERVVALGATEYFIFNTSQFSTGAPFTLAGSPVVSIYEDNGTTEITAGITLTVDLDSRTGMHGVAVVASGANGFEAGKRYIGVITTGTVDSVSVVGKRIFEFRCETAAERASRELREYLYPENTISTVTSNSTTAINLTDIVDAQTDDDSLVGQLLMVRDATDGALIWAVVTGLTSLVATVELYPNGGAMPITVAAGDKVWIMGPVYNHRSGTQALAQTQTSDALDAAGVRSAVGLAAANLDTQFGALPTAAEIQAELEEDGASILDTLRDRVTAAVATAAQITALNDLSASEIRAAVGLAAANLDTQLAALPTAAEIQAELEEDGASVLDTLQDRITAARAAVLSDWIDGGRLDLLLDAIKAKTDGLNFTGTSVQADIQAVDGDAISQGGSDPASPYGVT